MQVSILSNILFDVAFSFTAYCFHTYSPSNVRIKKKRKKKTLKGEA